MVRRPGLQGADPLLPRGWRGQTVVNQEYLYRLERIAADVAQAELEPRATKGAG